MRSAVLFIPALLVGTALVTAPTAARADPSRIDWQPIAGFDMARTETTVAQFRRFAETTGTVTLAERNGGGQVYEAGFVQKAGWTWRTPYGPQHRPADAEPAVHVTHGEAQAFCRWAGGRLPTDAQWVSAAYTEQRSAPPSPFRRGQTYPYPSGDQPAGAQCLGDCGPAAAARAVAHGATLWRGAGHAPVSATPPGVNGLHDMGANVWEWVDDPPGADDDTARRTRGGSWWYGQAQMRADHREAKPPTTRVVYLGFRCARER